MDLGHALDPRLDPYRGRAARLSKDGQDVGHLLVETQEVKTQVGGALFWKRWSDWTEMAVLELLVGDLSAEGQTYVGDELTELVEGFAAGRYTRLRDTYEVTWLDGAEAERVHREVFGHHH